MIHEASRGPRRLVPFSMPVQSRRSPRAARSSLAGVRPAIFSAWAAVSMMVVTALACVSQAAVAAFVCIVSLVWALRDPYVFTVLMMPFWIPFGNAQLISGYSFTFIRAVTIITVAAACIVNPTPLRAGLAALPRYLVVGLLALLVAYLLAHVANGFPEEGAGKIQTHVVRTVQTALVFVSVYHLRDGRLVLIGLILAGIVNLLAGAYMWYETGDLMALRAFEYATATTLVGSPIGVAILIAKSGEFAVLSGVAALALSETLRAWLARLGLWIFGMLLAFGSLFAGRREALLAMVFTFALIPLARRSKHVLALIVLLGLGTFVAYEAGPLKEFIDRREGFTDEFSGGGTGRWPLMTRSLELWQENPMFGTGPGTHARILWNRSDLGEGGVEAHNSVTGAMVEAGVVGGASVLVLLLGFLWHCLKALIVAGGRPSRNWPPMLLAGGGTIIASAATWDFVNHSGYMVIFGIVSAWCVVTIESVKTQATSYATRRLMSPARRPSLA